MGGYGITEDCPGFLFHKWNDSQLEATYEGPECVQRRQLSITMASDIFLIYLDNYIAEMERVAATHPGTGAASVAAGLAVWRHTLNFLAASKDADGKKLYHHNRQAVTFPLADALCPLLATRLFILDTLELETKGPDNPMVAEGLVGYVSFFTDLARIQSAKAAGEAARVCASLVHGYAAPEADLADFAALRTVLDATLAGLGAAREQAGAALGGVMIPEALDYPM
jgi:hypothetical protein